MALTSADLARLGPQAQKQVLDKLVGEQKSKKSKYGNRKVVRDGIKFDSEREAARYLSSFRTPPYPLTLVFVNTGLEYPREE